MQARPSSTEQAFSLVGLQRRDVALPDIPMQACSRFAGVVASSGFHGAVQNTQIARSPRQLWGHFPCAGWACWQGIAQRRDQLCAGAHAQVHAAEKRGMQWQAQQPHTLRASGPFQSGRDGCALPSARAASVCWLSTSGSCLPLRHQILTISCMLAPHCSAFAHVKLALAAMPASQACNSGPTRQHTALQSASLGGALPAHECASAGRADQGGRPWRWCVR